MHFEGIQAANMKYASDGDADSSTLRQVVCKPQARAFELALEQCGLKDPTQVLFLDDSIRNIQSAHALGMCTVLVGQTGPFDGADYVVPTLHDLRNVWPELLHNPSIASMDMEPQVISTTAVATSVSE